MKQGLLRFTGGGIIRRGRNKESCVGFLYDLQSNWDRDPSLRAGCLTEPAVQFKRTQSVLNYFNNEGMS